MNKHPLAFWGLSTTEMLQQLQAAKEGLTGAEAVERLARYGSNLLKPSKRSDVFTLLLTQFKSPLILILFFATGLSFYLHEPVDAFVILAILLVSGLLGFWQERGASNAVEKLLSIVRITAAVLRDGSVKEIPVEEIVPGDIVVLNAGDIVPGDCLVQESKGFSCNSGSIPNRMVLGIGLFSVTNCLGHTKPETLLQEHAVEISVCSDSLNGCPNADFSLHSTWHDFWV